MKYQLGTEIMFKRTNILKIKSMNIKYLFYILIKVFKHQFQ